jgi:hypothetical protein
MAVKLFVADREVVYVLAGAGALALFIILLQLV